MKAPIQHRKAPKRRAQLNAAVSNDDAGSQSSSTRSFVGHNGNVGAEVYDPAFFLDLSIEATEPPENLHGKAVAGTPLYLARAVLKRQVLSMKRNEIINKYSVDDGRELITTVGKVNTDKPAPVWSSRAWASAETERDVVYDSLIRGLEVASDLGAKRLRVTTGSTCMANELNKLQAVPSDEPMEAKLVSLMIRFSEFAVAASHEVVLDKQGRESEQVAAGEDSSEGQLIRQDDFISQWKTNEEQESIADTDTMSHVLEAAKKPTKRAAFLLMFDGGSRGNPGPAGAGCVLLPPPEDPTRSSMAGYELRKLWLGNNRTNNQAEYEGFVKGMEHALSMGVKRLIVEGDSLLVVNQMKGVWQVRNPELQRLHERAKQVASQFEDFEIRHIPRFKNWRADLLADQAIETRTSTDDSGGHAIDENEKR